MALLNAVTGNRGVGSYSLLASLCVHVTAFIFLGVIVLRHAPEPREFVSVQLVKANQQVQRPRPSFVRLRSRGFDSAEAPRRWQDMAEPLISRVHIPSQVATQVIPVIQCEPVEMKHPTMCEPIAALKKSVLALKMKTSKPEIHIPRESVSEIYDQSSRLSLPWNSVSWSLQSASDSAVLRDFLQIVRKRIEKSKHYPRWAMDVGVEGRTVVRFTIWRDGTLGEDIHLARSSGVEILDNAAIAAVKGAAPFPSLPQSLERECLQIELPMDFRLRES